MLSHNSANGYSGTLITSSYCHHTENVSLLQNLTNHILHTCIMIVTMTTNTSPDWLNLFHTTMLLSIDRNSNWLYTRYIYLEVLTSSKNEVDPA